MVPSSRESPVSSFCECNQCHCSSFTLAPNTLSLVIPPATDPVFLRAFLFQPTLETCLLLLCLDKRFLTFLVRTVLFPSFSKAFHDAPFSPQTHATATLSMVRLPLPSETRCNISAIIWLSPSLINQHRRPLRRTDCHNETTAFAER